MSRVLISPAFDGETVLQALRRQGHVISAPCGGGGKCGKCRVSIFHDDSAPRQVLACRTRLHRECSVEFSADVGGEICLDSADDLPAAPGRHGHGAAIDIGTTTIAIRLFDLFTGCELASSSTWNSQMAYGGDVITRIQYAMENSDGLSTLSGIIRRQISDMIDDICAEYGLDPASVTELYIAGNTVMQHIFCGLPPDSIALSPFAPLSLFCQGESFSLGSRTAYMSPCVAGYVGGDITAGLMYSGMPDKDGLNLFVDVGTNGEIVLGGKGGLTCCAVACGPAFEGAGISCGMASKPGAISRAEYKEGILSLGIVGGGTPRGICGSGLLDIAAIMVRLGIIDETGRLLPPDEVSTDLNGRLVRQGSNGLLWLDKTQDIYLSAADVRQLQLAKAAIAAGISVLLKDAGASPADVNTLYLAGGLGTHMDPASAVEIGMLPRAIEGRIIPLGNASLAGARLALLSEQRRRDILETQRNCKYIELSGSATFSCAFPEHMMFSQEDELWN